MALEALKTCRLIKSEDLNHHGTLFAGRCAEWFVESGFIAVAAKLDPRTVVCLKIHGMEFLHPVTLGSVLTFESRIVATGRSTIVVYVKSFESKTPIVSIPTGSSRSVMWTSIRTPVRTDCRPVPRRPRRSN